MEEDTGKTVLVVDDEPGLRRDIAASFSGDGYTVILAESGRDAIKKARQLTALHLLITDDLMPDMNGIEVMQAIRKQYPDVPMLVLAGHGTVRTAVEAMRCGANDFLLKPLEAEQLRLAVRKALEHQPSRVRPVSDGPASERKRNGQKPSGRLVGEAPATRTMKEQLLRAATSRATVLLLGESGTGKEVAARLLHEASPRAAAPFVAVSCAALPETLLESELFGHEKSAFTGATAAKPGRFELADGGTLFLDEIGDIPALTQVKLLRALQEREVCRIGGIKSVKVDVRVVAATNRDLWQAVQEGTFRLDLYYRLHVVPVQLPPLRERRADIPLLTQHFLHRFSEENGRTFPEGITPQVLEFLAFHDWPGNIRELQNVIEYAVVMSPPEARSLEISALPPFLRPGREQNARQNPFQKSSTLPELK